MIRWEKLNQDDRIKKLWRLGYTAQEILQRLPVNATVAQLIKRIYVLGLYENHNATDAQIEAMRLKRLEETRIRVLELRKYGQAKAS